MQSITQSKSPVFGIANCNLQQQACTRFHLPPCRLLLAVLFLFLCFMVPCDGQQQKVASWEMDVLQAFYGSTGGNTGAWNYASIQNTIQVNLDPGFIGQEWNFTKSVQGAYLYDPCPTLTSPPFMGVNCSCVATASACTISAIVVPSGNLAAATIPPAIGQLTDLTILVLAANSFLGQIPAELSDLTQLTAVYLDSNQLTSSIPASFGKLTQLTRLTLGTNQLASSVPPSLCNLTQLNTLDLSSNMLTSSIPTCLGDLSQLQALDLSTNKLTSLIPSSLGDLSKLEYLYLYGNELSSSIPDSLGNLTQVSYLDLSSNQLTSSIPASLGKLQQLNNLRLNGNQLVSSIPASLGDLSQLTLLSLSNNKLTSSIPASLGNLTKLSYLYLYGTQLSSSIPASFGKLQQLIDLRLNGNQLVSSIPASLGDLSHLTHLDLSTNKFASSIPPILGNLTRLKSLYLSSNKLTSSIPPSLGDLTQLKSLDLSSNQLTSSIPASLGKLQQLTDLRLNVNQLCSSIPASLGDLSQLTLLSLSTNQLTSSIPASLGNLTQANYLDLSTNLLTSSIPPSLGDLTQLKSLDLSSNQLTSSIPASFGNLQQLTDLRLNVNQLCSSIPASLGDLSLLQGLDLSSNQLTSSIPVGLGNLTQANYLDLSSNKLTSSIPASLGDLIQLESLYLSSNQLTSSIPASLGNLQQLNDLWLSRNQLVSSIPVSLGDLLRLAQLDLSSNKLTSSIPPSLGDLTQLESLYLSNNQLTSSIPASFGKLQQLNELQLNSNQLTSSIPASLGDLSQLTYLDLSINKLSSSIPPSLGDLTQLESLHLSSNQLTSSIPASLGNLQQLTDLRLNVNQLCSSIPASLGDLSLLQALDLSINQLASSIPASLGDLTLLQGLDLSINQLTGSIPASIGNLKQMGSLFLNGNHLTSSIPASLGNLLLLQIFFLGNNRLSSSIPAELGNLVKLSFLGLAVNSLVGVIPSSFGRLTLLTHLDLSSNSLSGIVPAELANLAYLNTFLLQDNNLGAGGRSDESAFSFIDPTKQMKLAVLDMSSNALEGPLSESVFALPSLEVFAAGSNCFSGELPSNLCNATKLQTLAITGLSSGASCRKLYWKDTVFSRWLGFDGFGADHVMQGLLPQCVYGLPLLRDLSAAGNSFLGQVPSSESGVSTSLQQIDVSRNRLTGSITKEIAAAMLTGMGGHLQTLNMSYNRIGGDLSAFAIANSASSSSFNSSSALSLEVNRLSGAIPQLLRSLEQINILTGNVFECSADRTELPEHDIPAVESYQCDSKSMNSMIYAFAAFVVGLIVMWETFRRRVSLQFHFWAMRTWLLTANGLGATSNEYPQAEIIRYSRSMSELRRFVAVVGLALLIVLIVYGALSGGQHRTLEHSYLWATTASYLTGRTSAVWLLMIGISMATLTCYLVTENVRRTKSADVVRPEGNTDPSTAKVQSSDDNSRWTQLRMCALPTLRLLVLIVVVWGAIAASNVWYLDVLLHGTPQQQEAFKLAFAVFKLVWTSIVTPMAFRSKLLMFGLEEERHNAFVDAWLGGEVQVMLAFNAISTFGIPLLVAMVDKANCFREVFIAAAPIRIQFEYASCVSFNSDGTCTYGTLPVLAELQVPFVYNYTCSSSMISAYVPLYQQMLLVLIAISGVQMAYLCVDISDSERSGGVGGADQKKENAGCLARIRGLIKAAVQSTLPTSHLLLSSSQRNQLTGRKNGVVYVTGSPMWITERIPVRFSNLLILVTFGVWAPLLGAIAVLAVVLDTYVSQLVIGRFLVTELGVVQERKLEQGLISPDSHQLDTKLSFTSSRRANMLQDLQDCDEPWGAVAALKEVEAQCAHWPASILAQGRTVLVVISSMTFAFLLLDVINGNNNSDSGMIYWPCISLVCYACGLEVASRIYECCWLDRSLQAGPRTGRTSGGDYKTPGKGEDSKRGSRGLNSGFGVVSTGTAGRAQPVPVSASDPLLRPLLLSAHHQLDDSSTTRDYVYAPPRNPAGLAGLAGPAGPASVGSTGTASTASTAGSAGLQPGRSGELEAVSPMHPLIAGDNKL